MRDLDLLFSSEYILYFKASFSTIEHIFFRNTHEFTWYIFYHLWDDNTSLGNRYSEKRKV